MADGEAILARKGPFPASIAVEQPLAMPGRGPFCGRLHKRTERFRVPESMSADIVVEVYVYGFTVFHPALDTIGF